VNSALAQAATARFAHSSIDEHFIKVKAPADCRGFWVKIESKLDG